MKTIVIVLVLFSFFQIDVKGDYVVMVDDILIEEENMDHIQSVASISKVMTALVALENGNIHDVIHIDLETTKQIGSSLYMLEKESYTLLSLIYGLMLRSGNDAAYAIANHVGGSQEAFVKMMNEKAKDIGMKNTIFSNPSGLDEFDNGNQSTVYDMALCMKEAMKHDIFRIITNTKQYKAENHRVWINKNRLLKEYAYCNGGKTGYTKNSGKTLITSSKKENLESIVVSFREDDYFMLHKRLHEQIQQKYKSILLIPKGIYQINNKRFEISEDIKTLLLKENLIWIETKIEKDHIMIRYQQFNTIIERKVKFI